LDHRDLAAALPQLFCHGATSRRGLIRYAAGGRFFHVASRFVPDGERFILFTYVGGPVFHLNHDSVPTPATPPPSDSAARRPAAEGPP